MYSGPLSLDLSSFKALTECWLGSEMACDSSPGIIDSAVLS